MAVADVLTLVEKDRIFYRQSGGGVTFSGGEALAQTDFLRDLVYACRARGISMVLETSGSFSWDDAHEILSEMDLIFLDLKHMDPGTHRSLTGLGNGVILENAVHIAGHGVPLVIRVPLVPGMNDDLENLEATAAFIADRLESVEGVEILPYHRLGKAKFRALGLQDRLAGIASPSAKEVERAREVFRRHGVKIVCYGSVP